MEFATFVSFILWVVALVALGAVLINTALTIRDWWYRRKHDGRD